MTSHIRIERVVTRSDIDSNSKRIISDFAVHFPKWKEVLNIEVSTTEIFILNCDQSHNQIIRDEILNHPFAEIYFDSSFFPKSDRHWFCLEKWFKPGVTDNVGNAFSESLLLTTKKHITAHSGARLWIGFEKHLDKSQLKSQVEEYSQKVFFNSLIEKCNIYTFDEARECDVKLHKNPNLFQFQEEKYLKPVQYEFIYSTVEELYQKSIDHFWAFSKDEIKVIQKYFADLKRNPTDVEIEILAQTWSEHCKHKIFSAHIDITNQRDDVMIPTQVDSIFKTYIKGSTLQIQEKWKNENKKNILQSIFEDNAGVVEITDQYSCAIKVETHNTPSALDPYGGSLTGVVGVNRDILGVGLGAEPIANLDIFCVGNTKMNDQEVPNGLHHPKRILEGVRLGIEHGGNKSGIPTITGAVVENDCYVGKPLVFCGTIGLMPNPNPYIDKSIVHGDLIVMSGGRIGADGIHGATFSSVELSENSPVSAVQLGDPLTQKRVWDFLIEARNLNLFRAVTDNGAGGLSSSIGELARLCGKNGGANLDVSLAKTKYPGLKPFELVVSESQERMSFAVSKENLNSFMELSLRRGVESTVLGEFVDTGKFHILYKNETVGNLDMKFLHEGCPKLNLKAKIEKPKINSDQNVKTDLQNIKALLKQTLASANVHSQKKLTQQYDHEVQARTIQKPYGSPNHISPTDGGALSLSRSTFEGVALGIGLAPQIAKYDMKSSAEYAFDEAIRNAICAGVDPSHAVSVDNFCWPDPLESHSNPDALKKCGELVLTSSTIAEMANVFEMPFVSGKDSMKNDYRKGDLKISILPTILISIMGKVQDVRKIPRGYATLNQQKQNIVWISGQEHKLSQLQYTQSGYSKLNYLNLKKYYQLVHECIQLGLIQSIHDVSDGGWLTTTAEMFLGTGCGAEINLEKNKIENLFADFAAGFVCIVRDDKNAEFKDVLKDYFMQEVGIVTNQSKFKINDQEIDLKELVNAYEN